MVEPSRVALGRLAVPRKLTVLSVEVPVSVLPPCMIPLMLLFNV